MINLADSSSSLVSEANHTAEDAVGSPVNTAAGSAGGTLSPVAGEVNGALTPLFNGAPSSASAVLTSVLGSVNVSQQAQLPFSPSNLSAQFLNNPAQLATTLNTASSSLSTGLGQVDLGSIGSLEDAANTAVDAASQPGSTQQQQLDAQQALINLQIAVEMASTRMNILGDMAKKAIDNARLQ